jgi:hypothetical protein
MASHILDGGSCMASHILDGGSCMASYILDGGSCMASHILDGGILYGQLHLGRRSAGGQMKRYKNQLKTWLKKCNIKPTDLEDAAADRLTWWQLCQSGVQRWVEERSTNRQQEQLRKHTTMPAPSQHRPHTPRPTSNKVCGSQIGLDSHQRIQR